MKDGISQNLCSILIDEEKLPGNYSVQLSTFDYSLSSGVYIYRLTSARKSVAKKMVLAK